MKRFNLTYTIKREDFFYWKKQDNFNQRLFITHAKIYLWERCLIDLDYLQHKNFFSKWWNNYYMKKDLIENYTYLDIDISFYEEFNLAGVLTPILLEKFRMEGIIKWN